LRSRIWHSSLRIDITVDFPQVQYPQVPTSENRCFTVVTARGKQQSPSSLPGISVTQAVALMQQQDRIIRSFPEVSTVLGTVGRSDSATDNAPLDGRAQQLAHGLSSTFVQKRSELQIRLRKNQEWSSGMGETMNAPLN